MPHSPQEEANLKVGKEYLSIVYSPNAKKEAVQHLVAPDSELMASTTLKGIPDLLAYADMHKEHVKQTPDLCVTGYSFVFAKDNHACIRYSAAGTHSGEPHHGEGKSGKVTIEASSPPKKAEWDVAAIMEFTDDHKLKRLCFEFNKAAVWRQWGWDKDGNTE